MTAKSIVHCVLLAIVLLLRFCRIALAATPVVIDFENLTTTGRDEGGQVVVNSQFAALGVLFNSPKAIDYSKSFPIPNFAHSGTKAIEQCFGIEFCTKPIEVSFTAPQVHVKIWAGRSIPGELRTVVLRAFDARGAEVSRASAAISGGTLSEPVRTPLEVGSAGATITRVLVSYLPESLQTNGLAVDDIEFDTVGSQPACASTRDPTISVTQPRNGQTVQRNAFIFQTTIFSDSPLQEAKLTVTSAAGDRTFDLLSAGLGSLTAGTLTFGPTELVGLLTPGENQLAATVRDCRGTRRNFGITVMFLSQPPLGPSASSILETKYVNQIPDPILRFQTTVACSFDTFPNFGVKHIGPIITGFTDPPYLEWSPMVRGSDDLPFGLVVDGVPTDYEATVIGASGTAIVLQNSGNRSVDYPSEVFTFPSTAAGRSGGDVWFTHPFGYDREFYVAPDGPFASLLAPTNNGQPVFPYGGSDADYAEFREATTIATGRLGQSINGHTGMGLFVPGVLGIETDEGLLPEYFMPREGDRVAVFGRWIADCGHADWHTEIHPPLLTVSARVDPMAPTEDTLVKIVGRPYLVGQMFPEDNLPLAPHLLKEVEKLGSFRSLKVEAHPKVYVRPFSGNPVLHFTIRAPSQRRDLGDRLYVQYHLERHPGIEVELFPENSAIDPFRTIPVPPGGSSDGVRAVIRMVDAEYWPKSEADVACCLGKHDWKIPIDSLPTLAQGVVKVFDILSAIETLGLSSILGDLDNITTDIYDAPSAPDPRFDSPFVSNPRNLDVTTQAVSSLTGPVQSKLVRTDGLGQPFPVLGWVRLAWVRTGATRHFKVIPENVTLVQLSADSVRTEANLGMTIQAMAIKQAFDGEAGHNSVAETRVDSPLRIGRISLPLNISSMFNLRPIEVVLTSEDTLNLRFTLVDKREPESLPCIPGPARPCPKPPATFDLTARLVAETSLNLSYTYDTDFVYTIRSRTTEGVAGPEYAEFTYRVIESRDPPPGDIHGVGGRAIATSVSPIQHNELSRPQSGQGETR